MTLAEHGGVDFDPRIHDSAFLEEIDLYSELIIAAGASSGPLTVEAIDRALGLAPVVTIPEQQPSANDPLGVTIAAR